MSEFILTFKLIQHTPLIHFQHNQKGATLRATEMKPKLDRFIIETIKEIPRDWFVGKGDHPALDYKLNIETAGVKRSYIINNHLSDTDKKNIQKNKAIPLAPSPYFADAEHIKNGNLHKVRKGIIGIIYDEKRKECDYEISIYFFSFNPEILKVIDSHFRIFLFLNNFGTRQSKGFGSFSLKDTSRREYEDLLKKETIVYYKKTNEPLKTINNDYTKIKSGPQFSKPLLSQYFTEKKIANWEKGIIIRDLVQNIGNPEKRVYDNKGEYQFIRALLGLADSYHYPKRHHKSEVETVYIEWIPGDKYENNKEYIENNKIERFQSPITFKVFENFVYVISNNSYKSMLGQKFRFYSDLDKKGIVLTVPEKFEINDFLQKCLINLGYKRL